MANIMSESLSEVQTLAGKLLSTLDESIFFSELSTFLSQKLGVDRCKVYKVLDDTSSKVIVIDGRPVIDSLNQEIIDGEGPAGHVIRTKRPYFSNNIERDPLFSQYKSTDVKAELCVPVSHEGVLIATLHFQVGHDSDREFSRQDINTVLEHLTEIQAPIANMKMYLSAKALNEILLKKIEQKDKELAEKNNGLKLADSFRIAEKEVICQSEVMKNIVSICDKLGTSDINVILQGESGTGKELLARRIHCRSSRKDRAFIVLDCSSMPEEMLEKELFGVESHELIGGHKGKVGILETVNGGTLLLKSIDLLSSKLQAKLSHFIKDKMAFRIGGQIPFKSDVRVIAASRRNLMEEVDQGRFREDLFYYLNTMVINMPALREHIDDIEVLSNYFLNIGKSPESHKSLSPGVLKTLKSYNWPGNVRELQNAMERAYILADGMVIERGHLDEGIFRAEEKSDKADVQVEDFQEMTLDELEKRHICSTLEHLGGNKTKTAKTLGITVKTLYNKLHSYGMIDSKEA